MGDANNEIKKEGEFGGRRRRHSRRRTMRVPKGVPVKAKTLKRMLKKAGLKCSGKKSTLRARARKAHLIRGGAGGAGGVASNAAGV
jgi:hypothetical protein